MTSLLPFGDVFLTCEAVLQLQGNPTFSTTNKDRSSKMMNSSFACDCSRFVGFKREILSSLKSKLQVNSCSSSLK